MSHSSVSGVRSKSFIRLWISGKYSLENHCSRRISMLLPSLSCTFRGVPGMSSPFCFHWMRRSAMSIWAFRCSSVASHRYCGISPEQMIAVFSDSTSAMGLSGCCRRRCSPKRHWVSCQDSSRVPVFLRRLWAQLILNFVNGVDRISEDKISAAMLRKFVNTVYGIMRDVKIPSCCRGFLL